MKNFSFFNRVKLFTKSLHETHIFLGVGNGKIRDSPRRRDPSQKSEPETLWWKVSRLKKSKSKPWKNETSRLRKTLPRFRDPAKIFRDPRFSRYHSPPLCLAGRDAQEVLYTGFVHYTEQRFKAIVILARHLQCRYSKDLLFLKNIYPLSCFSPSPSPSSFWACNAGY